MAHKSRSAIRFGISLSELRSLGSPIKKKKDFDALSKADLAAHYKALKERARPFVDVDPINVAPILMAAEELVKRHRIYSNYVACPDLATAQVSMNLLGQVRMAAERLDQEIKKAGLDDCKLKSTGKTNKIFAIDTTRFATHRLLRRIPDFIYLKPGEVFEFDKGAIRDIRCAIKGLQTAKPDSQNDKDRLWLPASKAVKMAERRGYKITLTWLTRDAATHGVQLRRHKLPGRHKVEVEWKSLAAYLLNSKQRDIGAKQEEDEAEIKERIRAASEKKRKNFPID
jgi:hypothetical protein